MHHKRSDIVEYQECDLVCLIDGQSSHKCLARVVVKKQLVQALYKQALDRHRFYVQARGFARGKTPVSYLERTCRSNLIEHMKEFLLNHCVINTLCQELYQQHTVIAGDPQLTSIAITPESDAEFNFSCSRLPLTLKTHWRDLSLKAPARRNYKDLDRQVELFIQEETARGKGVDKKNGISMSDWVLFSVSLIDHEMRTPLSSYKDKLWMKIGKEEIDRDAQLSFLNKKEQDLFITDSTLLQNYFSKQLDTDYLFALEILAIVPHATSTLEHFKHHFGLSSNLEVRRMLIEIFSHRHDISLRRETVEATLKQLVKQITSPIPSELIRQQEALLLREIQRSSDYPVYRLQKDFRSKISTLAAKQLHETLIIDHIAHEEGISVSQDDVNAYIALLQRPRTKEFIYFDLPIAQMNGQEQPLPAGIIQQACLREKTLNKLIKMLSRKGSSR
ncbi:TPA: hypothetical protein DDZ86_04050 [Candidatus Dependentiae bacterium]|nr:hypothetical protein [Candidatus Dependentiae bacterium]